MLFLTKKHCLNASHRAITGKSVSQAKVSLFYFPSEYMVKKWRRIDVDATWSRRIDVNTTSFLRHVPAGLFLYLNHGAHINSSLRENVQTVRIHMKDPSLHRALGSICFPSVFLVCFSKCGNFLLLNMIQLGWNSFWNFADINFLVCSLALEGLRKWDPNMQTYIYFTPKAINNK